jgi:FkbM family methyltransferase
MRSGVFLARALNKLKLLPFVNLIVAYDFDGSLYKIPVYKGIGFYNIYSWLDYDFKVYRFFSATISKGIFLDIGANLGQTLLRVKALDLQNEVFCVEPNPNCVAYLHDLKDENKFQNVQIIPAALFESAGLLKLFLNSNVDTGASLVREQYDENARPVNFYYVNSINARMLEEVLTRPVSFIKIDVEGVELSVLKLLSAIIEKNKPVIYCEVLDAANEEARPFNIALKASTYEYVTETLNYNVFSFSDQSNQLEPITVFPDRIFKPEGLDICNYVLMPR